VDSRLERGYSGRCCLAENFDARDRQICSDITQYERCPRSARPALRANSVASTDGGKAVSTGALDRGRITHITSPSGAGCQTSAVTIVIFEMPICRFLGGSEVDAAPRLPSTELAVHSVFAADPSAQTTPLLPSWSAITVSDGALLSSMTVPPAATAMAIRCSATSGAT